MDDAWQSYIGSGSGVILDITTTCLYEVPVRDQIGENGKEIPEPSYSGSSYGVVNCYGAEVTNLFKPVIHYLGKKRNDYSYIVFRTMVDDLPVIIGYMEVKEVKNAFNSHVLRSGSKCQCAKLGEHWAVKGNMHFVSWNDAVTLTAFWNANCAKQCKNKKGAQIIGVDAAKEFVACVSKLENVTEKCAELAEDMRFSDNKLALIPNAQSNKYKLYDELSRKLRELQ